MKRRFFLLLAVLMIITAISQIKALASAPTSESSAKVAGVQLTASPILEQDNRAQILRSYLEQYNSPLADHADTIIKEADTNNIDWRMLVAISGVESNFGIAIPASSYNAWGYNIYGSNVRSFDSWDDGVTVVSSDLRNVYMNQRGATNIYQIGATYAADPNWAYRVQGYMDDIDQYSKRFDKPTLSISL